MNGLAYWVLGWISEWVVYLRVAIHITPFEQRKRRGEGVALVNQVNQVKQ